MRTTCTLTRLAALSGVVMAAMALAACDVVVSSLDAKGKAEDQWSRSYPLASGELEVVNANGQVEVVGGEGSQVEVVAERTARAMTDEDAKKLLSQVTMAEEVGAAKVRLEAKVPSGLGRSHVGIKYRVKVPAGVNLRLHTDNGTLDVTGVKGSVMAEAGNGSVKGRDLAGTVEASTTNGSVRLEMAAVGKGGVSAKTVNGSVELTIPSASKADVEASCINGRISTDGLKLDGPESTRRRLEGRLNGGGPKVVLETTNGRIQLTGK
jgi:hypothetical protein